MAYTEVRENGIDIDRPALMFDYEYCTGCHSCEVTCKMRLGLPEGSWGIKLLEYGPVELGDGRWELVNIPYPTMLCDLCQDRIAQGKLPECVHNCPAACIQYGTVAELTEQVAYKSMRNLFVPYQSRLHIFG